MVSLLAVFAVLTAAYVGVLFLAARSGSERFKPVGPLLMFRTQRGKGTIDYLSRNRAWGPIADGFIVLTLLAGIVMLVLVVYQNTLLFTHTDIVRERPPRLEEALAIPGINPVIPVGYGIFALLVALVVHEGGHGVLARYAHLPVKSLGLLFLVIPVGAFVEPDEGALQRASLRNKLRLFAAGPGPNLVLATACVLLFSQGMAPGVVPAHEGVGLTAVTPGLPADQAGIDAGTFVTAIGGAPVRTLDEFQRVLNGTRAGQPLVVSTWHVGETRDVTVVPMDRYEYYAERDPDGLARLQQERPQRVEDMKGKAFLGVGPAGPEELRGAVETLQHPFRDLGMPDAALFYIALPFIGLQPAPDTFHDLYDPTGAFAGSEAAYWITLNTLYWLFWINVVLGTFNALPLGPLDGGHMFRHTIHSVLRRRTGIRSEDLDVVHEEGGQPYYVGRTVDVQDRLDQVERKVKRTHQVVGYTLLVLVLAPLIVPRFL